MIQKKIAIALLALSAGLISCSNNDDQDEITTSQITLDIDGLEDLGADYMYEGWIIVEGNPITTGVFSVDSEGVLSSSKFDVDKNNLQAATKFVLSIEPTNDSDPAPSETKYLVGDFDGSSAALSTGIIADFSSAAGTFILATPTDNSTNDANDENGIWWLNPGDTPTAALVLPELPEGWKYEGWVVENGIPITTGTFTNIAGTDEAAPFSGSDALADVNGSDGFFPGEDFLINAPSQVTFPLDVRGKTAVISIEPYLIMLWKLKSAWFDRIETLF